jgi:transposase-like protein
MRKRRSFTREFKLAAVKKVLEKGLTVTEVANELGIRDTLIHNWRRAFQADGSLQNEILKSPSMDAELQRLREENRQLKIERDILKKATVFFAKEKN